MRLHPRTLIVRRAGNELAMALVNIWATYNLTPGEVVSICAELTSNHTRFVVRQERHPNDSGKKADEA